MNNVNYVAKCNEKLFLYIYFENRLLRKYSRIRYIIICTNNYDLIIDVKSRDYNI